MRLTMFWPGLNKAWHDGDSKGLLGSVLFAWTLCWLLVASFIWTEWVSWPWVPLGWTVVSGLAIATLIRQIFRAPESIAIPGEEAAHFQAAQREYLSGNWFDAEAELLRVLKSEPDDFPAGLLLVGVLRHTGRFSAALRRLEQLGLLDAAQGWQYELAQEKLLVEREEKARKDGDPVEAKDASQ